MFFTSDNGSGAAPEIMAALARANSGFARGYGADDIMTRVTAQIRHLFDAPEAAVYLVASGTAANALALASYIQPYHAIFAHTSAHIAVDECGAPEFFTNGAKLIPVAGDHGKMTPETLSAALSRIGNGGVHGVQRGMMSITNLTEAGTAYTPAEVAALPRAKATITVKGASVVYEGALLHEVLLKAGLARATHLFVAVPSPFEAARIIEQARAANPKAEIIARAYTDADVELLKSMGASHALVGEDEIAKGMLARAPKKKPVAAAAGGH